MALALCNRGTQAASMERNLTLNDFSSSTFVAPEPGMFWQYPFIRFFFAFVFIRTLLCYCQVSLLNVGPSHYELIAMIFSRIYNVTYRCWNSIYCSFFSFLFFNGFCMSSRSNSTWTSFPRCGSSVQLAVHFETNKARQEKSVSNASLSDTQLIKKKLTRFLCSGKDLWETHSRPSNL